MLGMETRPVEGRTGTKLGVDRLRQPEAGEATEEQACAFIIKTH